MKEPTVENPQNLYTIKQFVSLQEFSFLTEAALRHHIFYSQPRLSADGSTLNGNGLAEVGAIVRIGRKILIDVTAFRVWLSQSTQAVHANKCR